MKGILFFFLLFWGILLHAQNENVVIDGVTFSADRKTLISYPRDKVDEEYIVPEGTEVIGENAFLDSELHRVTLPFSLKEIEDYAFHYCLYLISITWGNFPEIVGESIFLKSYVEEFYVSSENSNCIAVDYVLFSADKKTLLRYPPRRRTYSHYAVPEGTEIIRENAFDRADIVSAALPSTLKTIKDGAFWLESRVPVRSNDFDWELEFRVIDSVICDAIVPPLLVGKPFLVDRYSKLYVPDEGFESYCNAPGWKDFKRINNKDLSSVNSSSVRNTKAYFDDFILNITSEQQITKVCVYNQIGALLREQEVGADSWFWNMEALHPQGLLLIRVVYDDFTEDVFKLIK